MTAQTLLTLLLAFSPSRLPADGPPIRRFDSPLLTLHSDLPPEKLELLAEAIEAILPEWAAYFGTATDAAAEPAKTRWLADWKVTGYVMADAQRFRKAGLLPERIPDFPHGISQAREFWMHDQADDYYRRHLLLHEATHCYLRSLGRRAPTWYDEGIAEMFATHRYSDGQWTFRTIPASKTAVPGWGRVPLIKDAVREGKSLTLDDVCRMPSDRFLSVDQYAWCWALCTFLDQHPRYQQRFRRLPHAPLSPTPGPSADAAQLQRLFGDDLEAVAEEWSLFAEQFDYGYDIPRTVLDLTIGTTLKTSETRNLTVAADVGWQNAGIRIERGRRYEVSAQGRFTVADRPQPWTCEPAGISFRYVAGKPIGRLLAAVRTEPAGAAPEPSGLKQPIDLGPSAILQHPSPGTLYLRINDAWGELSDNRGHVAVTLRALD